MKTIKIIVSASILSLLFSCANKEKADGYGNFEATEITVSSEAKGKLEFFDVEEGQVLEKGKTVGLVDTLQLYLNKAQLRASKTTVKSKSAGVWSQVSVLNQQLKTAKTEQQRIQNMFADSAATQRQLDQANSEVHVLQKKIKQVETQNAPIVNEVKTINAKIAQINDKIARSKITNPTAGTVLTKYAEPGEVAAFGKPLYKIADLSTMELRAYVSEPQLSSLKTDGEVTVKIDSGKGMKSYKGTITWISDSAEFTPKIIQTKEERVNLVYAVKISVKNDGSLKIGMPGEMWL